MMSQSVFHLLGRTLHAAQRDRIGAVRDVLTDADNGVPEWLLVDVTSVRGLRAVPLAGVRNKDGSLSTTFTANEIQRSPPIADVAPLGLESERRLLRYWDLIRGR
ncbi:hypothetical protein [Luteipulveratus mongoliensis]|uniref:hypothetical protein n=1 Tax=Luteipulveratus mongoliensis TaxID=571913 RepID=UPI0012EDA14A|nr:hypothetical protein [Luteipulveratus mongoliensis]